MILFIGSNYWDTVIDVDETISSDTILSRQTHSGPGGNACNSASTAGLLHASTFITPLAEDVLGKKIAERLNDRGVAVYSPVIPDSTKRAWVVLEENSRRIYIEKRKTLLPDPDTRAQDLIREASVVDFYPSVIENISSWHQASQGKLRARSPIGIEEEMASGRKWEILIGSAEHRETIPDETLESLGVKLAVLTEAEHGGKWWSEGSWKRYEPAPLSDKRGDSVGAGDAFRAGLLAALARGLADREAINLAAKLGALALADFGAWIRFEAIRAALEKNKKAQAASWLKSTFNSLS